MHRLHLLRHAKSSWKEEVEDRERPLNRRGRETARLLGRGLPEATGRLDLVLCSSARRARETLDLALSGFAEAPRIVVEDELYLATPAKLLRRLRRLDETDGNVLVIGHNPGMHELALALAATESPPYRALAAGKFPTAALASFEVAAWPSLGDARCGLIAYTPPGASDDD